MKKSILMVLAVMLGGFFSGRAQNVTVMEDVTEIVVSTDSPRTTLSSGNQWKAECPFLCSPAGDNSRFYYTGLKDIYWGWNFNYDEKNGIKNCFEVGVGEVVGLTYAPFAEGPTFNVGLGFGMRRYLVQDGLAFNRFDNCLFIEKVDEGMSIDKSRLDSWTFHLPVMVTQKIYKHLAVSAGAWLNFNTYVKGETQYYWNDVRYKEQYKGFNQRFFTVDIVAAIGIKNGISFYGRWSPMTLFSSNRGPSFRSASMGVMLNF